MLNLNYLRYFYICSQIGSVTKAAAKLGISQPSLSMQIKTFEQHLGFQLFIRAGRTLQLTPKGQSLFLYCSKVFEITDEIEQYLKHSKRPADVSLKIAVSDEVERPFVAAMVGKLIKTINSRNLTPSIISKKHEEIVQMVVDEDADLLITNQKVPNLKLISELEIPVVLLSANASIQSRVHQMSPHNILRNLDQKLILPTDEMILGKETLKFLKETNAKFDVALNSNIIACIVRGVQEKVGAAFLPALYVHKEIKSGSLRVFGPMKGYWNHRIYLYSQKNSTNEFISKLAKLMQDQNAFQFFTNGTEVFA